MKTSIKTRLIYALPLIFCLAAAPAAAQEADVLAPAPLGAPAGQGHGQLETLKNMTPEERKAFIEQQRAQVQNMTPEEKEAFKAERKAKFQNLSPEQKEQLKAAMKERSGGREFKGRGGQ